MYTGRQIAIFTDIHGLLEPTIAVLYDIKRRGIKEIYSLGDDIGIGPNPREVLELLKENNVKSINGNAEEYIILGSKPFESYFDRRRMVDKEWTKSKLTSSEIIDLANNKHSYDLEVGGKKIGLCHFANDVRIDFDDRSTYSYQFAINSSNPNRQFYYTNSETQKREIEEKSKNILPQYYGFHSAKKDPIFGGKTVDYYDEIIEGHVHFRMLSEDAKSRIRTIRGLAIGYSSIDPVDFASYIIIKEKNIGYDVEEVLVPYNRTKMLKSIEKSDMPIKTTINSFVKKEEERTRMR